MALGRAVSLQEGRNMDLIASDKVNKLERNVAFLRQQHSDTLGQLHIELERLKKENRGTPSHCNVGWYHL